MLSRLRPAELALPLTRSLAPLSAQNRAPVPWWSVGAIFGRQKPQPPLSVIKINGFRYHNVAVKERFEPALLQAPTAPHSAYTQWLLLAESSQSITGTATGVESGGSRYWQ